MINCQSVLASKSQNNFPFISFFRKILLKNFITSSHLKEKWKQ